MMKIENCIDGIYNAGLAAFSILIMKRLMIRKIALTADADELYVPYASGGAPAGFVDSRDLIPANWPSNTMAAAKHVKNYLKSAERLIQGLSVNTTDTNRFMMNWPLGRIGTVVIEMTIMTNPKFR
jgi:hypothetical protein